MPRKLQTAQRPYTLLVANLAGGSDPSRGPSGNPVKIRTGFTYQHFPDVNRQVHERGPGVEDPKTPGIGTRMGHVDYTTSPVPVGSTCTIDIDDNDFTADATLHLGEFTITSNEDYTPGGTDALTAVALAAAIDGLPGFSAVAVGDSVTVTGPPGPGGNNIRFEAEYRGSIANFILDPTDGSFTGGEPTIGPPLILP
jgi:hypothetical protein